MSDRLKLYLAGACHGVGAVWVAGYVLFKTHTPLDALFDSGDGVAPAILAVPVLITGCLFLLYSLPDKEHVRQDKKQPSRNVERPG